MDTNLGLATQPLRFLCSCRPDLSLSEAKDVTVTENGPRFTMRSQQPKPNPWSRSLTQKRLVRIYISWSEIVVIAYHCICRCWRSSRIHHVEIFSIHFFWVADSSTILVFLLGNRSHRSHRSYLEMQAWISQPWTLTSVFSLCHTSFMTSMILNRQLVQLLDLEAFSGCPKSAASGKKKRDECCWNQNQVLLVKFWILDNAGGKGHPTELTVEKASLPQKAGRLYVFCLDFPLGSNTSVCEMD